MAIKEDYLLWYINFSDETCSGSGIIAIIRKLLENLRKKSIHHLETILGMLI